MVSDTLVQGYILALLVLANVPFFNQRLFLFIPVVTAGYLKPFWFRLVEWFVLYGVGMGIGFFLENQIGGIQHKPWEFWVVTLFMFATLAAPGFVWQYQLRRQISASAR
ncbi:MAG: DUF2818 family protein [Halothiobacillus sp.]